MKIKVMTFNTLHCMNYLTHNIDFDIMADTIRQCGADIIGMQEMRDEADAPRYDAQTRILAEKLGYHYYYFAEAIRHDGIKPYGNALISRFPILSAETIMIPDPEVKKYAGYYETRCILKATIDAGDGLTVMVSHFGLNPDEWDNAVQTALANIPQKQSILMGDFNMSPANEHLAPLFEKLYDTAEKFAEPKLSFPADEPRMKLDYIFTTEDIMVLDADIPAIIASDHRPYVTTIDI